MTSAEELQQILKEMREENKRSRHWARHFISRDGLRHYNDYNIRSIESSYYKDKNGKHRCRDCGKFVVEPRHKHALIVQ